MSDITQEALIGLMEALKDPIKKAKILEGLLAQNKINHSPLNKVKNNRVHLESPTSLHRRRALEEAKDNTSDSSSSISDPSESSAEVLGPKLPFDKILKGVIAFVEVKLGGKEQSEGIKMIVQSMGATVRDKFTRDVTHVIFKDGGFKTYEKAKLLKCHLVSVLWVDAVRRNSCRVSEAKYRPFGPQCDNPDISIICTKLQKDYEAIVKDEKRRSFSVPRLSKIQDKRKTLHAPSTSNFSSFRKSLRAPSSSAIRKRTPSPGITSDDSDCGIVNGHSFNYLKNVYPSTPSITDDASGALTKSPNNISNNSSSVSGSNRSAIISDTSSSKAETSALIIDSSAEKPVSKPMNLYDMIQPASQNISAQSSNKSRSLITRRKSRKTINKDTDMDLTSNVVDHNFNLNRVSDRAVLKEAATIPSLNISTDSDRTPSDIFRKSLEKSGTTMSSLRVSSDSILCKISNKENTVESTTSSLRLSKDKNTPNKPLVSQSLSCLTGNKSVSASPRRNVTTRKKPASSKKVLDADLPLRLNFDESAKSPRSNKKTIPSNMKTLFNTPRAVASDNSSNSTNNNESPEKNSQRSVSSCSTDNSKSCEKSRTKKIREIGLSDSNSEPSPTPSKIQKINETTVKKKTIRRKLYDPDDVHGFDLPDDEQEREERFHKKTPPVKDFVDPNNVSSLNVKKGRKNMNKSLTASGPSSSKSVPKSAKTSRRQLDISAVETEGNSSNKVPKIQSGKKVQTRSDSQLSQSSRNGSVFTRTTTESEDEEVQSLTARSLRRSQRLSVSEQKPRYNYSSASSTSTEDLPIKRIARRSTLDFQSMSLSQKQRMFKNDQISSIVCTKFHRDECEEFQGIVKRLGRFYYEKNVTEQTTHVVAGECKRTLNILKGIARGCWILKHEWLLESDQEGRWLPEEDYELTEFSKAVQKCRLERQAFGPSFSMDIFANCGNIYVGAKTNPPAKDLKQLIILCKGTLTMQPHNAKISVGQIVAGGIPCVSELWVLDSITFHKLEKTSKFLLQPPREDSPEF